MYIMLILGIIWAAGLFWFAHHIPGQARITRHYDAIIVLTGGEQRIAYGLSLLHEGRADTLFITGVSDRFTLAELPDMHQRSSVTYGNKARNTLGNIRETMERLDVQARNDVSPESLLIVTANYHMPRVALIYDHYLHEYTLAYAPVAPPLFEQTRWFVHMNSLRLVLSEYHKFLASYVWVRLLNREIPPY